MHLTPIPSSKPKVRKQSNSIFWSQWQQLLNKTKHIRVFSWRTYNIFSHKLLLFFRPLNTGLWCNFGSQYTLKLNCYTNEGISWSISHKHIEEIATWRGGASLWPFLKMRHSFTATAVAESMRAQNVVLSFTSTFVCAHACSAITSINI